MEETPRTQQPLIGYSIVTVVIIILASFSNVVGYQSTEPSIAHDSPLFTVRTTRATTQASDMSFSSEYLGKGMNQHLQLPVRDTRTQMLKNIIESMKKMDDATFQEFFILLQQQLKPSLNEQQLRDIHEELTKLRTQGDVPLVPPSKSYSYGCPPSVYSANILECILYYAYTIFVNFGYTFLAIFLVIYQIIHYLFPGIPPVLS